jgi:quercetin dioxygenase-like cupin family protein
MTTTTQIDEQLTIYSIVPPKAAQGWKLELFVLAKTILPHFHKLQRQIILVVEGELKVICDTNPPQILRAGDLTHIDPGVVHALIPINTCRFFAFDMPGFDYPDDVYHDLPGAKTTWIAPEQMTRPLLDPAYFGKRREGENYAVYDFFEAAATGHKWSAALLEIQDSPRHYHQIEKEHFIVVDGILDLELSGTHQKLAAGDFVSIMPGSVHRLKSAANQPVRVLCFNFPAFTLADMRLC